MNMRCKNCGNIIPYEMNEQYETFEMAKGLSCCDRPDYWVSEA